ncbi:sugar transferase [Algoriphagus machipongonensis]|uniref:Probable CPS biosynthesis glycosyltransferase n=1 Tax=Algoriphagus machipongonensis TaxID=388413 RepID=A3HRS3_9BACT|nr:sugar transferase [Algoriphagus machipongonensis]EAZ82541.1 probable CPS biosynthesis glycosyltransferase [Algoriphagus machipongonensis]
MTNYLRENFSDNSAFVRSQIENNQFISKDFNWRNLTLKRFGDLFGASLFFLICGFWLFPLVGLLIKIDSKGPIFFKQVRVGLNGKLFHCYKFRTMVVNSEANIKQATENDPRVTKIGKFLRKISMDELPQFMNVIYGNMSLVGPRPLIPLQYHELEDKIVGFAKRNLVKPGISGLAQAKGYRGETKSISSIYFRHKLDMYYLKNWYPFMDLKLIWMTIDSIVFGDNKSY